MQHSYLIQHSYSLKFVEEDESNTVKYNHKSEKAMCLTCKNYCLFVCCINIKKNIDCIVTHIPIVFFYIQVCT